MTSRFSAVEQMLNPRRDFMPKDEIGRLLARRGQLPDATYDDAQFLKIFETHLQTTWLVATRSGLDCVIDAVSSDRPKFLWHIGVKDIIRDGNFVLSIVTTPDTERTGFVIIGDKRPRRFSLFLFSTRSIKESIKDMLGKALKVPDSAGSQSENISANTGNVLYRMRSRLGDVVSQQGSYPVFFSATWPAQGMSVLWQNLNVAVPE